MIQEARREACLTFLLERACALWIPSCLPEQSLKGPGPTCRPPGPYVQTHWGLVGKPKAPDTLRIEWCHDPSTQTPWGRCLCENPLLPPSPGLAGAPGRSSAQGRCSRPAGIANVCRQTSALRTTSFSLSCRDHCQLQLDAVERTQILVSCLDSNPGVSICQLDELKYPVILFGPQ